MTPLEVCSSGVIEEAFPGFLHVDFANRYVGGGVLCGGCVQEEIRFSVCPLATVALLLCPMMEATEAILITGCEQFSSYKGYGFGLRYGGNYVDPRPRDADGSVRTCLVAIDAIPYGYAKEGQAAPKLMLREMVKAYAGFSCGAAVDELECVPEVYPNIATGNWGCGAFGGDKNLKSVLQWLAASQAGRPLRYYSFGEGEPVFSEHLQQLVSTAQSMNATVGTVFRLLMQFQTLALPLSTLHAFLIQELGGTTAPAAAPM